MSSPESSGIAVHLAEDLTLRVDVVALERAVALAVERERATVATLSLALVGDAEISRLNAEYLGHEGPTDVISFALHEDGEPVVGDVYIGAEQAARQAAEHGVALEEELLRLVIHGTLHVLGHDHPAGEERLGSGMYRRQEELLEEVRSVMDEG